MLKRNIKYIDDRRKQSRRLKVRIASYIVKNTVGLEVDESRQTLRTVPHE